MSKPIEIDYGETAVSAASDFVQHWIEIEKEIINRFHCMERSFGDLSEAINEIWPAWALEKVFDIDLSFVELPQPSKPEYDPFKCVEMWKTPRRHKRPYKHVKYNQYNHKQAYRSRK